MTRIATTRYGVPVYLDLTREVSRVAETLSVRKGNVFASVFHRRGERPFSRTWLDSSLSAVYLDSSVLSMLIRDGRML